MNIPELSVSAIGTFHYPSGSIDPEQATRLYTRFSATIFDAVRSYTTGNHVFISRKTPEMVDDNGRQVESIAVEPPAPISQARAAAIGALLGCQTHLDRLVRDGVVPAEQIQDLPWFEPNPELVSQSEAQQFIDLARVSRT